jgi:hypothetical protein
VAAVSRADRLEVAAVLRAVALGWLPVAAASRAGGLGVEAESGLRRVAVEFGLRQPCEAAEYGGQGPQGGGCRVAAELGGGRRSLVGDE